tara:strand:- start:31741 stop:32268 length:528 start_codon:yes stop_codon:yes gene_type:complete
MNRIIGILALLSLIVSTGMVMFILTDPLMSLILTPYLVLSSALTLSFSIAYFFKLNEVKSKLLNSLVYSVAFLPTLIPLLAIFDADLMEMFWRNYISLTLLQLGVGVLSATMFFRYSQVNFTNVCGVSSAILLFTMGILVIAETNILSSMYILIPVALVTSLLFFLALVSRMRSI